MQATLSSPGELLNWPKGDDSRITNLGTPESTSKPFFSFFRLPRRGQLTHLLTRGYMYDSMPTIMGWVASAVCSVLAWSCQSCLSR